MIKKAITLIILILLTISLTGCTQINSNDKINVVCTIFPQYDWVKQILGDNADNYELTLLLDNKIDLHNYQPSVDDIVKVSNCDLFIYVGGESDKWVADTLKQATNTNMIVINLIDVLGDSAKAEEITEGMEEDDDENEAEYDEHVWLSLKNAQVFCLVIAEVLSSLDSDNSDTYQNNLLAYVEKLITLDAEYKTGVDMAAVKTLLFGDRFPFRYLVDDYGLDYYAAFPGCSAETEASFDTLSVLLSFLCVAPLPVFY